MDPLFSVKDYMTVKSFKLSDCYSVEIFDREPAWNNHLDELFSESDKKEYGIVPSNEEDGYKGRTFYFKNCRKFSNPSYEPKEEIVRFCNTTRVIYVPNDGPPQPFKIDLHETERRFAEKFIKYCLRKNFYDENLDRSGSTYESADQEVVPGDDYNPYRYIDRILVHVWDNQLKKIVLTHKFQSCRLVDYDYKKDLSYEETKFVEPTLTFSFLKYSIDPEPDN